MRCILNIIPYFKTNVNRFTKKNKKIFLTRLLTKQDCCVILYIIYYIIYIIIYYILYYLFINILIRARTRAHARSAEQRTSCCRRLAVYSVPCEALAELVIAFKRIIRGLEGPKTTEGIPR